MSERRVLRFSADWCGPCRQLKRFWMTNRTQERFNQITFEEYLDDDEGTHAALFQQYKVQGLPTLIFMFRGREVDRVVGVNYSVIESKLEQLSARQ